DDREVVSAGHAPAAGAIVEAAAAVAAGDRAGIGEGRASGREHHARPARAARARGWVADGAAGAARNCAGVCECHPRPGDLDAVAAVATAAAEYEPGRADGRWSTTCTAYAARDRAGVYDRQSWAGGQHAVATTTAET